VTAVTDLLEHGEVEIQGRMPWSSNGTFLVTVGGEGREAAAIYKPRRLERPLWDFPGGLDRREVAAYLLSRALGWQLVPETVLRDGAPLGPGSLQRFVDADFSQHYFTLLEQPRHRPALMRMALFDLLANNADRKGGHCLVDADDHVWGIDHGLCFHTAPKLRTVIWDFAGEEIPAACREEVAAADFEDLGKVLTVAEHAALVTRARALVKRRAFPEPRSEYPYPWPLV
jgi:uncharacterized repeat protein (TIGR03843 family)